MKKVKGYILPFMTIMILFTAIMVYTIPAFGQEKKNPKQEGNIELSSKVKAGNNSVPMQRVYNPNSGEHFYTASIAEKKHLITLGWHDEGIGWIAPSSSAIPVYRLYNKNGGDHHYTLNKSERNHLIAIGWKDEGIGWYSDANKREPVYRQYNSNAFSNNHNYTTNISEKNYLIKLGWRDEGIAWYGTDNKDKNITDTKIIAAAQSTDTAMQKIEESYLNSSGYIPKERVPNVINDVSKYVKELQKQGIVKDYTVNSDDVFIRLTGGLQMAYIPKVAGVSSNGDQNEMTVLTLQPYDYFSPFDENTIKTDILDNAATNINKTFPNIKFSSQTNYNHDAVTLDLIKSFSKNQIILWDSHGNKSDNKRGPFIATGQTDNEKYTLYFKTYKNDRDALVYLPGRRVAICAEFVNKFCSRMDNSFIWLGSCSSGSTSTLANAFKNKGASTVIGFTDTTKTRYIHDLLENIVKQMTDSMFDGFLDIESAKSEAEKVCGKDDSIKYNGIGSCAKIFGNKHFKFSSGWGKDNVQNHDQVNSDLKKSIVTTGGSTKILKGNTFTNSIDLDHDDEKDSIALSVKYDNETSEVLSAYISINGKKALSLNIFDEVLDIELRILQLNNGEVFFAPEYSVVDLGGMTPMLYKYQSGSIVQAMDMRHYNNDHYSENSEGEVWNFTAKGDTIQFRVACGTLSMARVEMVRSLWEHDKKIEYISPEAEIVSSSATPYISGYETLKCPIELYLGGDPIKYPNKSNVLSAGTKCVVTKGYFTNGTHLQRLYISTEDGLSGWFNQDDHAETENDPIFDGHLHVGGDIS